MTKCVILTARFILKIKDEQLWQIARNDNNWITVDPLSDIVAIDLYDTFQ